MNKPPKRRVLTAREKLMRKKYTRLVQWDKRCHFYAVFLTVDFQSFGLGAGFIDKHNAEWTRDMLAAALAKIEL